MYALCQYLHCIEPRLGSLWIYPLYPTVLVWKARLELACSNFFIFYFRSHSKVSSTFTNALMSTTLKHQNKWSFRSFPVSFPPFQAFNIINKRYSICYHRRVSPDPCFTLPLGLWKPYRPMSSGWHSLVLTSQTLWIHNKFELNNFRVDHQIYFLYVFSST